MRITPNERQKISDIIKDEIEGAITRIEGRLSQCEVAPLSSASDQFDSIRKFYEEMVGKVWTQADEDYLISLGDMSEGEIKQMMRDGFRRSPVYPVPNFASLINALRRDYGESQLSADFPPTRSDAISTDLRERLSNLLAEEMAVAVSVIASRMDLSETGKKIVFEEIEVALGQIISRFTPLV
ncbi:MAG: hypothetical protein AB1631_28360 [Acidobacteriota bacterium]